MCLARVRALLYCLACVQQGCPLNSHLFARWAGIQRKSPGLNVCSLPLGQEVKVVQHPAVMRREEQAGDEREKAHMNEDLGEERDATTGVGEAAVCMRNMES